MVPFCRSPETLASVLGTCATVTVTWLLAFPSAAWICAVPFATAATRPVVLTAATLVVSDDQVTVGLAIGWPF